MNRAITYLARLVLLALVVGSYKFGLFMGRNTKYYDAVINTMAKMQYSLAFREGFLRGATVACGAYKGYEGPDYDELHPSPAPAGPQ